MEPDEADPADLADADVAGGVRNAEVDVVEGAFRALRSDTRCRRWPVGRAVGGLEVEDTVDIAVRIERQALDRVLRVVGEEVAALVAAGELGAVIDEAAGDGRVAAALWG